MKKSQYIIAASCILISAAGFVGIYAMDQSQKNKNKVSESQQLDDGNQAGSQISLVDIEDTIKKDDEKTIPTIDEKDKVEEDTKPEETKPEETKPSEAEEAPVVKPEKETLHFSPENGIVWPVEGTTLLDYSMDATIYFPTLNQYQYNPAMVIAGDVNSKVYFVAKGKITNIETNEVTGCTVTQDLGDGYTAIYGQLKELNFGVGDTVESGQVVGYISEPTKYYSVEGSNVYFQLLKDGKPVDPTSILP